MNAPHYVAKRVGDEFQLVRRDSAGCVESNAFCFGGGLLAWMGLRRRSVPGLILTAVGGGLIYRGVTGRNPLKVLLSVQCKGCGEEHAPSFPHEERRPADQVPADEIEEASMESFPASDPPAHSKTATS